MLWTKRRTEDGAGARWRSSWLTQGQGEGTQPKKLWRWWDRHLTKEGAYSEHQKKSVLLGACPGSGLFIILMQIALTSSSSSSTSTSLFWTPERQHYLALVPGLASAAKVVSTCPGLSCTPAPVWGWYTDRQYMFKRKADWWIRHLDKEQTRPSTSVHERGEIKRSYGNSLLPLFWGKTCVSAKF